ncbi:MAG: hypothetical protein ACRDXX_20230 [Stackebrandtia sp.]
MSTQFVMDGSSDRIATSRFARRAWAWGGLAFPLLFAVSMVFDSIALVGDIPRPGASADVVVAFYEANSGGLAALRAGVRLAAALGLAAFALHVAAAPWLRTTSNGLRRLTTAVGVASAVFLAVSPAASLTAQNLVGSADPETIVLLRESSYLFGGVVHLAVMGAYAALLTVVCWSKLTRTVQVLGLSAAALGLAVPLNEYLNPPARLALWIWLVVVVVIALRGGPASTRSGPKTPKA